jgi:hypothetical protein
LVEKTIATIDETERALSTITSIPDARKWLHISEGLAEATIKEYKATDIKGTKEDRDTAYRNAVKAGELRLKVEAKLGEMIKLEQEAGRLADKGQPKKCRTVATLKDYGLTKDDSSRAQKIAEHKDLIPVVVAKAIEAADIPTRKDFEKIVKEREGETQRNTKPRVKLPEFLNDVNPIFYEFSVWEVPGQRPEGGLATFRGNCSPYVCAGCLYNYSKAGDIVLDPMVGSGTFLDVARAVTDENGQRAYSQIVVSDLNPVRNDIRKCDAAKLGLPDNFADFVFTHFPYWNSVDFSKQSKQITSREPNETDDLSKMPWNMFIEKSKAILAEQFRVLKENAYFCLMVGAKREDKYLLDLPLYFKLWGQDAGFSLYDEILIMTYNPRKINFDSTTGQRRLRIGKGRQDNALNICHDYVLVFRKDNV